jgi:transposase
MTLTLVQQLRTAVLSIRVFDAEINTLFCKVPDAPLFNSLLGTGPCLAPRLFVAFGEVRERFNSAEEIQKYAGIASVTERSGQKSWVHWRWQCSTFLRQSFIEWAAKSVNTLY